MRDTVNSRLRRLLNKCKARNDVASELEREQGPVVEALKLFRAEIEKRKDKRRVSKLKAAMDGDMGTFRRLSAQGGMYRCVFCMLSVNYINLRLMSVVLVITTPMTRL